MHLTFGVAKLVLNKIQNLLWLYPFRSDLTVIGRDRRWMALWTHFKTWWQIQFLDAPSHRYKRECPSVGPSVRPSVRLSIMPSLRRLLGASYAEYSALFSQCVWHISHRIIAMEKSVKNSNVLFCAYSLLTDMLLNISNCYEGPPQSVPRSICYVIFVLMQLAYCNWIYIPIIQ